MKTKNSLSLVLLFAVLSLPFAGCKKTWDHISNGPGKELKMCNIKKLVAPGSDWEEAYFTYNKWGNPEKVIRKISYYPGSNNYFFQYDDKQRLITFINTSKTELVDGDEVSFERFQYNEDGTVYDTGGFSYGIYKAGQILSSDSISPIDYHWAYQIFFDTKGRVSKVYTPGYNSLYYNYDERGNLMYPKDDRFEYVDYNKNTYDNNVNFLRTNKVWMFLNRDYSTNNKYNTSGINCYGLPTGFTSDPGTYLKFYQNLFGTWQNQIDDYTEIEYECDCGTGSSK